MTRIRVNLFRRSWFAFAVALVFASVRPAPVDAHQPRIVAGTAEEITDPEVSKAYYDELTGEPRTYRVTSEVPFVLALGILAPLSSNPSGRYSAAVLRSGEDGRPIAILDGASTPWTEFHEPFANDWYVQGPSYRETVTAGTYTIVVSGASGTNLGRYVLAVGEAEAFSAGDVVQALMMIPQLKRQFFEVAPATFALSWFGGSYLALLVVGGAIANAVWRRLVPNQQVRTSQSMAPVRGRRWAWAVVGTAAISLGLAAWAPIAFVLGGFALSRVYLR